MKNSLSIGVRKISNGYIATLRSDDPPEEKKGAIPMPTLKTEKSAATLPLLRKHIDKFLDECLVQK